MNLADVTLREGDQMPGRAYTRAQKVACARRLDELGVPFIQPAFPITGEKDQGVLSELAGTTDADLIALARALEGDIDVAVDAGADIVETFASGSDRHLKHLLGMSRAEMETMLAEAVDYVRDRGATPHVTVADAFRTDQDSLLAIFEALSDVPYITLADSVGVRTPTSVRTTLEGLAAHGVDLERVGVHFHDDLGCATANTLVAAELGVGKADVSVGGLGERAGNCPLEEVVAAGVVDDAAADPDFGITAESLIPTCRDILETLEEPWDERKAVLGAKTADHESGIHTAAMLKDPATLEPYDPAVFGGERRLFFGAATGREGARLLLERAGREPTDEAVSALQTRLADGGPLELEGALALASEGLE